MAVDVADKNLRRAIRAADGPANFEAEFCEVILPGLEVVRTQGEVIAAIMGNDGLVAFADKVQFLEFAETKPGTRESKGGPGNSVQAKNGGIEFRALFDVLHVQRDVVQLEDFHCGRIGKMAAPGQSIGRLTAAQVLCEHSKVLALLAEQRFVIQSSASPPRELKVESY